MESLLLKAYFSQEKSVSGFVEIGMPYEMVAIDNAVEITYKAMELIF